MSKVEDILASTKVGDVLDAAKLNKFLKRQEEEEKKPSKFVIVFAVIGIVVAVAAAIYGSRNRICGISFLHSGLSG